MAIYRKSREPQRRVVALTMLAAALLFCTPPARAGDCAGEFASTFEAIQKVIFERHSCADAVCHGSATAGGLDLREGVAYANLVDVPAQTVSGYRRVSAGRKESSLLWYNLAAGTFPDDWKAPLRPMPLGLPPLTPDELEVIRLWIERGAPETGTVPGTAELLNACLPPVDPPDIAPLPPPEPGKGLQIHMPQWVLPPHSENEVCFASYYDVTDQVPEKYRGRGGRTFRFRRNEIRQDARSHHLIANLYLGTASIDSPVWGEFKCRGGARDGEPCDPTDQETCGPDSGCASQAVRSLACIGFGPADYQVASFNFSGSQEASNELSMPPGVFAEIPLKGIIVWNSHAFNLDDEPRKVEAWLNYDFAEPEEQRSFVQPIFDTSQIFRMNVPPFQTQEVCHRRVLPEDARLYQLNSHTHRRGKRFRIFDGAFTCQGGPADGQSCTPFGPDFVSPDLCAGFPCQAWSRPRSGDCNRDGVVTVGELIRAVNVALGDAGLDTCPDADIDGAAPPAVRVNELLMAVNAALNGTPDPRPRDPGTSLLYVNFNYNDPTPVFFEPPRVMPGAGSPESERTLTYCALYDNGYSDPSEVHRHSTSPPPPPPFPMICRRGTHCFTGKVGAACRGESDADRNASCDSVPGAGDGLCDACATTGGVTTEDEMFVLLGMYYLPGVTDPPFDVPGL